MYGERIEFETFIVTLSPLHVGGAFDSETIIPADERDGGEEIAVIQRDARGAPFIPGSTLKGAFRSVLESFPDMEDLIDEFFGAPLDRERGRPGRLIVHGASFVSPGQIDKRREAAKASWGYLTARTAIDGRSGTADTNKLFKAEVVTPGAHFRLRFSFAGTTAELDGKAGHVLGRLLAVLAAPDGIALGRGKGDGWGRVRLPNGSLEIEKARAIVIDKGAVATVSKTADGRTIADVLANLTEAGRHPDPTTIVRRHVLKLRTDEPFLVKVENPITELGRGDDKGQGNRLVAMRDGIGRPELPGSSFMGALRARAEWFWAIEVMRRGSRAAHFRTENSDQPSDPIERLFGTTNETIKAKSIGQGRRTGWAGLLRLVSIRNIDPTIPSQKSLASVRIDRFSAEPFGGGLFFVDAFVAPAFEVVLGFERARPPSQNDEAFLTALLEQLVAGGPHGGLALGHGSNRGFGWFDVVKIEEAAR